MTAVWVFALFALFHTGMFQGTLILQQLSQKPGNRWSLWATAAAVFFIAKGFFEHSFLSEVYESYQVWVALPGMFLILLILLLLRQIKAGKKIPKGGDS